MNATDNPQRDSELQPKPGDDRMIRLEEHMGFVEHTIGQLSEEVRLLNTRVHDLGKKLIAIEARLGRVAQQVETGPGEAAAADAQD